MARTVHVLRRAAGGGEPHETDAELGVLLLDPALTRSERNTGLMKMVTDGADPIDADLIKRAIAAASGRRRRLQPSARGPAAGNRGSDLAD